MDLSQMFGAMNYSPLASGYYGALSNLGYSTGGGSNNYGGYQGDRSPIGYNGQIPGYTIAAQPNVNQLAVAQASLAAQLASAMSQGYAANAQAQGNAMGNWYNAEAATKTAPYNAWATEQSARMNSLGNMNVAQINNESKQAALNNLLKFAWYKMPTSGQRTNPYANIQTNYGGGVSYA